MSRRLTFHNAAERELTDAAAYSDNSSPGLGNSFIDDVERAITQIERYPESGYLLNATGQLRREDSKRGTGPV